MAAGGAGLAAAGGSQNSGGIAAAPDKGLAKQGAANPLMKGKSGTTAPPPAGTLPGEVDNGQLTGDGAVAVTPQGQPRDEIRAPTTPGGLAASQEAFKLFRTGRQDQARELVAEALKNNPDDVGLQDISKRIAKHETKVDTGSLIKKVGALLWNPGETETPAAGRPQAPQQQAQLASPLGFLTAPAGASPAAMMAPAQQAAFAGGAGQVGGVQGASLSRSTLLKMQMADYAGAERELSDNIARQPDDWMAYRMRALTRRFLKKYEDAENDAERAIGLTQRKDAYSHGVKALIRLDVGDPAGAIEAASEALQLNPKDSDALVTRGMAFQKLGRREEALTDLKEAAELNAQFGSIYRRALAEDGGQAPSMTRVKRLYVGAAGLAILLFGASLIARRTGTTTVRPPMRAEDHGPTLGGFRILRRVGQGGMGVVFEAFDETLERRVALKRMRDEIAGDPRERRRFMKEARLVAGLRHPAIVEIFSVVEQDPALFLVFEFLQGEPLNEVLRAKGRLSPSETIGLARQIAEALDFAHAHGVVHQDLKPGNIVVGKDGKAKVMDFGIARKVQETLSTMSRCEVVGTPAYMAPEQEQGVVSPKSDIFAFGACLYEMLSGRPPFAGNNNFFAKSEMRYPRLAQTAALPAGVDEAIARALDPNPGRRPATAKDVVLALEQALQARA